MLKRLLLAIFPFLAGSCEKADQSTGTVTMMDPNEILFSLATICDPIPSVSSGTPAPKHRSLAEDDWRQIEFVPAVNRGHIDAKLSELIAFREAHRKDLGFTNLLVRAEHPTTLASLRLVAAELVPSRHPSLALGDGLVPGGFFFADRSGWFLYGQQSADGRLQHLAVSPGYDRPASAEFCRLLSTIAGSQLLLVDWYAGIIVDSSSPEAIQMWAQ